MVSHSYLLLLMSGLLYFCLSFVSMLLTRLLNELQSGDKAMVLCFVEFADPKCALTAMEALQGIICAINHDLSSYSTKCDIKFSTYQFYHIGS